MFICLIYEHRYLCIKDTYRIFTFIDCWLVMDNSFVYIYVYWDIANNNSAFENVPIFNLIHPITALILSESIYGTELFYLFYKITYVISITIRIFMGENSMIYYFSGLDILQFQLVDIGIIYLIMVLLNR